MDTEDVQKDFDLIDSYKDNILKYLYTDIKIQPESDLGVFLQSRIQMFLSQSLLRSLFLKEHIVQTLNSNNFPSFYALVKSFLEIPAQLGYLTFILYENKSDVELRDVIHKLVFAHKGGLSEDVGVEPKNVLTMFDKLDLVMSKTLTASEGDSEDVMKVRKERPMRTIYEDVCNYGHPNFMAHISIGGLGKDGIWRAKDPQKLESYKFELYGGFYMNHFTMAINAIFITSRMLVRHPKVDNFKKVNNPHLKI